MFLDDDGDDEIAHFSVCWKLGT